MQHNLKFESNIMILFQIQITANITKSDKINNSVDFESVWNAYITYFHDKRYYYAFCVGLIN